LNSYEIIDTGIKNPDVSIAMLTYNHSNYIVNAIEGILMQQTDYTYKIIIAEDCSTDNTREIIIKYQNKYPDKFKLILQDKNVGPQINNYNLLTNLEGKYIAALEGDDYWIDPLKLQKQLDFLENNPDYGIVFTDYILIDKNNIQIRDNKIDKIRDLYKSGNVFFDLLQGNFIPTLTVCLRKEALDPLLYLMNKPHIIDYWIWFHISIFFKVKYLPSITAAYRRHQSGLTSDINISDHLKKGAPIYYDTLIYFYKNGKFSLNKKNEKAIVFRSCMTNLRSKDLNVSKRLFLLMLGIYYFSPKGFFNLITKKINLIRIKLKNDKDRLIFKC
jgi:glycosyltransferase involved in cell wall biosynthesis